MIELVVAVIAVLIAAAAVVFALRPRAEDPAAQALRNEMLILRETTEKSIQGISSVFSAQLQSTTSNVQTALASVTSDIGTRLEAVNRSVSEQLQHSTRMMAENSNAVSQRMSTVQQTFAGLQKQVGEMSEQARQLAEMSKAVTSLERVLMAPKLRGGFGEAQLESLLATVFARDQFQVQFAFSSGDIADAVLFFPQGKVAIDAKFPLENFRRMAEAANDADKKSGRREFLKDVKKRIDEIAAKYIRPADGTMPFALMYIPAENVYYESIIRDEDGNDLYEYCLQRRVVPVSPNSLYAYLQTIVVGLNSLRVSQRAETILRQIESLRVEMGKFNEAYEKVGGHLRNASERYDDSYKRLEKIHSRVEALSAGGSEQLAPPEEGRALGAGS